MLHTLDFYYFSPTGGTKKTGQLLAKSMASKINEYNLAENSELGTEEAGEISLVAVPVFSGRIPEFAAQMLKKINGNGKKAVALVVYGTRAYEDALLELNDVLKASGFQVIAAGAFIARHSIVTEVGRGRPDEKDEQELKLFGQKILEKLDKGISDEITIPGNYPYRQVTSNPVSPICTEDCSLCGTCVHVCPLNAITVKDKEIITDVEKCILCMACVHDCPKGGRILPPPLQEQMNEKLGALKGVYRENEIYI